MKTFFVALAALLALPPSVGAAPVDRIHPPHEERLSYTWRLEGFTGAILSLFLPRSGEGSLTMQPIEDGFLKSELLITSEKARDGEFWLYGAVIEPQQLHTTRAWSAYRWRGDSRERESEVPEEDRGVVDISSAIYLLRRDLPTGPRRMTIWSDGRLYPVLVMPEGEVEKTVPAGTFKTLHYRVQGIRITGERFWSGSMELWFSREEGAVPVEIFLQRKMARVRLKLDEIPDGSRP